jgi:hypothetical protein
MKGLIWKSNEFREPQKFRFISDKNRELNLVFIAILGTRRSNFSDASLKNLCAGKISYGIARLCRGGHGVFWWGWTWIFFILGQSMRGIIM